MRMEGVEIKVFVCMLLGFWCSVVVAGEVYPAQGVLVGEVTAGGFLQMTVGRGDDGRSRLVMEHRDDRGKVMNRAERVAGE